MTKRAVDAIRESDAIVGYRTYLKSIADLTTGKEIFSFAMRQETQRCKTALELVSTGKKVALISSGDPGIYGMAGLALELASSEIDIEIIPGVTAASIAASMLGAPLTNDFAVISLSDLLTSWDVIEARVEAAAKGDFVVVFYNPGSKKRSDHIKRAAQIILEKRQPSTPVGVIEKNTDENYDVKIFTLRDLEKFNAKMNMTIIVGNSQTFTKNNKMMTTRGYKL